jgi:hypothetical protein
MNSFKLPYKFDAKILKNEVSQIAKVDYYDIHNPSVALKTLWSKEFIKPTSAPGEPAIFGPNESLKRCPILLSIFKTFQCPVETFRFHSLQPAAVIKSHRDSGFSFEHGKVRLHIPIQTNDAVEIRLEGKLVSMKEGECWYCNFDIVHEVHNRGKETREHLIIDCMVNEWLSGIFEDNA